MARTTTDLYRSVMDKTFKIKPQIYPGDGVLYPRWEEQRKALPDGSFRTINKDVDLEVTPEGVAVLPGGGTSLHDIPAWFNCQDFFIPAGTEYSDEIHIKADRKTREHPRRKGEFGRHYQLEPRTRMLVVTFKGYLDNMARAAVARQVELAKAGS
jgi:hypothetical protein